MKLSKDQYDVIRKWMYRYARPLDIARWKFHFENGSRLDVLTALSAYQNEDGGFGHGLEADSLNPNSSPIQTWCATEILYELRITHKNNTMVKSILAYLESKKDFIDGYWLAQVPSNNEYPRAPWWTFDVNEVKKWSYNPTINLVGFILFFADINSELYHLALKIAKKAVSYYLSTDYKPNMHEEICFMRFYDYCMKAGITEIFDVPVMRNQLIHNVTSLITTNKEAWKTDYVCRPSQFFISPKSIFYQDNIEISEFELEYIMKSMNPDGSWNINWNWDDFQEEWNISKNWWKAHQTIMYMLYLKGFECF
ncbi:hypothetical protein [Anaeromicropila herbilytica]|uniref:Uncharacterized protein n=1 Tax=Anaeromicropila herbilytica TaxID=2785025 RepID=A0A7R7EKU3_9FIRM|nr:hypothetical protein [Anaeromicropila herbilytica]BCN30624.1 hypothetical protein bsdtb5_19190 [Anaeromicropila herbilytica]